MLLSSTLLILTLYTFGRIIIVNRRHKNIMIDVLILLGFIYNRYNKNNNYLFTIFIIIFLYF